MRSSMVPFGQTAAHTCSYWMATRRIRTSILPGRVTVNPIFRTNIIFWARGCYLSAEFLFEATRLAGRPPERPFVERGEKCNEPQTPGPGGERCD